MLEKNIKIRILEKSDYSQSYLNWFSDPDVVRFSENRKKVFSKEGQIEYIKSFEKKENLRISSLWIEFDFNSGKIISLSIAFKIAPVLNFGLLKKGAYTAST